MVGSRDAYILSARFIEFFKLLVEDSLLLELVVSFVKHKGGPSILDRIVRINLNVFMQDKPR